MFVSNNGLMGLHAFQLWTGGVKGHPPPFIGKEPNVFMMVFKSSTSKDGTMYSTN